MNVATPLPPLPPLHGAVLVGGASRRMGRPKATLVIGGLALAERVAEALRPVVERLVLVGEGPVPSALEGLPRLADARFGPSRFAGPLAGLLAVLRSDPAAAWLVAPCDLPAVCTAAAAWLASQRRPERHAVLPRPHPDGPPQPLFAIYEPTMLPAVEAFAAAGGRAPRHLAELPHVAVVTPPAPLAPCWRDADHPADLPPSD